MERHRDQDFEKIRQSLLRMGGLVERMISEAMAALVERDIARAQAVIRSDASGVIVGRSRRAIET